MKPFPSEKQDIKLKWWRNTCLALQKSGCSKRAFQSLLVNVCEMLNGECLLKAIQSVLVNVWIAFKWFWMSDSEITCDHSVPSQIFNQLVFRISFSNIKHGESAKQVQVLLPNGRYISCPKYLFFSNILLRYLSKIFWLNLSMNHCIVLTRYVSLVWLNIQSNILSKLLSFTCKSLVPSSFPNPSIEIAVPRSLAFKHNLSQSSLLQTSHAWQMNP